MRRALELARQSAGLDEVPVGAVVVVADAIVGVDVVVAVDVDVDVVAAPVVAAPQRVGDRQAGAEGHAGEQGVAEGDFVAEDPKQAAGVIWSMLHGVYVILGHPLRREIVAADLEALYQAAMDLAIKGLRPPAQAVARE